MTTTDFGVKLASVAAPPSREDNQKTTGPITETMMARIKLTIASATAYLLASAAAQAAVLDLTPSPGATTSYPIQLSTLLQGDVSELAVGTLRFSDFSYTRTGDMPSAESITVSGLQDPAGNWGLSLSGSFRDLPFAGASGGTLSYITAVEPFYVAHGFRINGAYQSMNAATLGNNSSVGALQTFAGKSERVETFRTSDPPSTQLSDSNTFQPSSILVGITDIYARATDSSFGSARFTLLNQSFSQATVPIARRPQTHVLSIAISDNYSAIPQSNAGAVKIANAFKRFKGVASATPLTLDDKDEGNKDRILQAIADVHNKMEPGDSFIFYINTHGGFDNQFSGDHEGDEPSVLAQNNAKNPSSRVPNAGDEFLHVAGEYFLGNLIDREVITDDEMHDWFALPEWDQMNKLFIIDSCHSGGFWNPDTSQNDSGDLGPNVRRTALLAAADEADFSFYGRTTNDPLKWGYLGKAVEDVLSRYSSTARLDFDTLGPQVAEEMTEAYRQAKLKNFPLYINGYPEDNWGEAVTLGEDLPSAVLFQTADFNLVIEVPEPQTRLLAGTLFFLAVGQLRIYRRSRCWRFVQKTPSSGAA